MLEKEKVFIIVHFFHSIVLEPLQSLALKEKHGADICISFVLGFS